MESLKNLILSLTAEEIQMVEAYYSGGKKEKSGKKLKLFLLIKNKQVNTNGEALQQLYEKQSNSAFSHLKSRLKKDILNLLLISSSNNEDEDIFSVDLECRKLLIQAKLLLQRGLFNEGLEILNEVRKKAEHYELYDIQLAVDDIYYAYPFQLQSGIKSEEIEQNENQLFKKWENSEWIKKITHKLKNYYHNDSYHLTPKEELYMDKIVKEPPALLSKRLAYQYNKMAMIYWNIKEAFNKSKEYADLLIQSIKENPRFFSREEIGGLYIEMAKNALYRRNYQSAMQHSRDIEKIFTHPNPAKLEALRFKFVIFLEEGDLENAEATLTQSFASPYLNINNELMSIWTLYKAALQFRKNNFQLSVKILKSGYQFLKERSPWMIGYRLLEILNIIEMKDMDWVEYKMESLRKYFCRYPDFCWEKYQKPYRLLRLYLNFHHLNNNRENKYLPLIHACLENYYWTPLSVEVINMQNWLEQRLRNTASFEPNGVSLPG